MARPHTRQRLSPTVTPPRSARTLLWLSCRFRGLGDTAGEGRAEPGEGELGQCDERLGGVETERAAGNQADGGVGGLDAGVGSNRRLRVMAWIWVMYRGCG